MTPIDRETIRELGRQAARGPCPNDEARWSCDEIGDNERVCADCHIFHAMRVAEEKIKCSKGK